MRRRTMLAFLVLLAAATFNATTVLAYPCDFGGADCDCYEAGNELEVFCTPPNGAETCEEGWPYFCADATWLCEDYCEGLDLQMSNYFCNDFGHECYFYCFCQPIP